MILNPPTYFLLIDSCYRWLLRLLCYCNSATVLYTPWLVIISDISTVVSASIRCKHSSHILNVFMQVHRNSAVYHEIICMQRVTNYISNSCCASQCMTRSALEEERSLWRTIAVVYCNRAIGKVHGSHRSRCRCRLSTTTFLRVDIHWRIC